MNLNTLIQTLLAVNGLQCAVVGFYRPSMRSIDDIALLGKARK